MPPEIVSENGEFSIGLFGENDTTRIVTDWLYFKTKWGCYDVGVSPNPPTPSVYEQILGTLNNKSDIGHIHDVYVTRDEVNELIKEKVSEATDEFLNAVSFDAGNIIERS